MTDPTSETPTSSRLQELFVGTLEYLQEQCGDDDSLMKRVKVLLAEDGRSFDPLEQGVDWLIQEALDDKLRELREGLHVRCPHCSIPIELLDGEQWNDLNCPSCGSSFSLTCGEETLVSQRQGKQEQIAHFTLNEQVGVGSFGAVWNATDTELDRTVALKIPRRGQLSAGEAEKFLREARAAAQLKHPNIVSVHEVGRDGETIYIVSEFIKGLSLADWLTGQKPTFREAVELCVKVCDALQHAHAHGIIHRDLKPGNILLDQEYHPHLTDFGLAKRDAGEITMTLDGQILGTPAYMSPEQARGEGHAADARSDVYSVGVILFELLTGERPFRGNTRMLLHQLLNEDAPSPRKLDVTVPKDLETICLKCLEKDPDKRYASAKELQSDLQCYLDNKPIAARPVSRLERGWRWCKRNPAVASLLLIVLILLLLLGIGGPIVAVEQLKLASMERNASAQAQKKTSELQEKTKKLNQKTSDLTDELHISKALRLAVQSQSVGDEFPVRRLLLAVEAVEATHQHGGTVLPTARENLFEAVAHVGGLPCAGHESELYDVAISPDGHWMATGSTDHTARLWDLTGDDPTASPIVLRGHENVVSSVVFSPDGRRLVTVSFDKTVRLWDMKADDIATSSIVLPVSSAVFSPDGRWLATGLRDKTARLWDLTAEDPDRSSIELPGHERPIIEIVFSPDGRWLATDSWDKTARLWDLTADEPAAACKVLKHEREVHHVAFSPDSRWLATVASEGMMPPRGTLRLWDLTADDLSASSKELQGPDSSVGALAFSPDSHWLAAGHFPSRLWDLTADDPASSMKELQGTPAVLSMAFSPDKRWLATGSPDRTARLWDLTAEVPGASSLELSGHDGQVKAMAFSPDSRWLATGSDDKTARLWDLSSAYPAKTFRELQGQEGRVNFVDFSPDGRWLVTASKNGDRIARLWDMTADLPATPTTVLPLRGMAISPDGRWLATSGSRGKVLDGKLLFDCKVRLWSTLSGYPPQTSLQLPGLYDQVNGESFSPDGRWLATTGKDDGKARLWDLTADNPAASSIELEGHDDSVSAVRFIPNSRWLVTVCQDGKIRMWDRTSGNFAAPSIVLDAHQAPLTDVAVSPAGRWMATISSNKILLWDLAADHIATAHIELPTQEGQLRSVVFSPDGHWLAADNKYNGSQLPQLWDLTADDIATSATELSGHEVRFSADSRWVAAAGSDHKTRLWDLTAGGLGTPSVVLAGHDGGVASLEFSPDNHWLATGAGDKTVRLWDLTANKPASSFVVVRLESSVSYIAFSPDSRWLATGSDSVRFWDLDIDSLIKRAKTAAGRELTPEERKQYLLE